MTATATTTDTANAVIERWNDQHPVGTRVIVPDDEGGLINTTTRSRAWLIANTPVVNVVGLRSACLLREVKVIP